MGALVEQVAGSTGVVRAHLVKLQSFAREHQCLIGIRPVDRLATDLIEDGYPTKGFHIKGKSANWGPQAAFICADQRLSKLENRPEHLGKFNGEVNACLLDGYARKVPLVLGRARLDRLLSAGMIDRLERDRHGAPARFEAKAPSGKIYTFDAVRASGHGAGDERFEIRLDGKAVEVLAPPREGAKPLTADYDLFAVAPRLAHLGPEDNLPVPDISHGVFRARLDRYRHGVPPQLQADYAWPAFFYGPMDAELGNVSARVRRMIPLINEALVGNGEPVVHHGADEASHAADTLANYPLTFALPEKIGRFEEVCLVNDEHELAELVCRAKEAGYHVPLNPLWEPKVTSVRRPAFVAARERMAAYFG
ncbi:adenylate cyclase [Trinickia caryophylli]|nr:adenylate cyclase [Trinickia caryophylli]TRX20394.1 adenylate cyclase [Trinickia caryophylli]